MPRRYFNWKLAVVLFMSVVVLCITAVALRRWQKANSAKQGLVLGNKAYDEQNWEEAVKELGMYLVLRQDDVQILFKYADAQMHIRPCKSNNIQQAIAAYRAVLRVEDTHQEASEQLTEIYLMIGMPVDAELIARRQLEQVQDPNLSRMLAIALAQQRKFNEAANELKTICAEQPDQILAYETLGQIIEQHPEEFSEQASDCFDEAVKNNPSSALAYLIRASFHQRNKAKSQALDDIKIAEQQDLSDTSVRLRLARELINLNMLDEAEQHLAAIHKILPTNQDLWQIWAQLALRSQSKEKMQNTAENGLKELSSQSWDFMPLATELFIRSGQLDRASDCIAQLRQKEIPTAIISFLEGLMAAEKGNLNEAVKYWQQSVESGNKTPQIRLTLASALISLGNRQSALRQIHTLLTERPDSSNGHLILAKMSAQTENWLEAEKHAARAMELEPGNSEPALLYLRTRIQRAGESSIIERNRIMEEIEKQLSKLNETNPGNLEVGFLQFQLKLQQANFIEAQQIISRLKQEHPSEIAEILLAETELLTVQDKTSEAISKLNQAIKENPDAPKQVKSLAILLYRQDDRTRCEEVVKNAIERIDKPEVQRELGLLLVQFYNRWSQTEKAYDLLINLSQKLPNDILIKRQLLTYEQVINNPEKARQIVDRIKSLEGENGWQWRYEQAKLLYLDDDFKNYYPKIISLTQENILANPDDQSSRMLLARAYDKAGELQLAIATYRDALSRSPDNLRIMTPTIAALYKAKEYEQAEELLNRASRVKIQNPQLQKLQLHSFIRRGELDSASDILQDLLNSDPNNQNASLSLALLKMQQKKYEESEDILAQLKTQNPESLAVIATQIQLYLRQNKPEEALEICREMINNFNNASAYILSARTYATIGQLDEALQELERAISIEPDNVEVWVARSDFYRSVGHTEKAAADIQHALSMASDNIKIQKRAISLFLASGQPNMINEGKNFLDKALESNPDDIELQLFKVNSLIFEGTAPAIEESRQILQAITEKQPEVNGAWQLLGELMLKQGQSGKAVDIAMRGLAYKPNDKSLLILKARAELVRSPILAIPTLKELCELDPNDSETIILLASTYITTGEPQKAVDILRKQITTSDPSTRRKYSLALAMALYKAGDKIESQKEFDSLLESEPNDPRLLIAQAQLLKEEELWSRLNQKVVDWYKNHRNDSHTPVAIARDLITVESNEAKQTAENIIRLILKNEPLSIEAIGSLALLLEMSGRSAESAEFYQQLLDIEPRNLIATNNLAWIMSEDKGQYQQALELAQKGLELNPNYIDLIETRGVIYYRLGELNKAVQDLTKCVELYPDTVPQCVIARFHLARTYAELGKKDEALRYLNQALELESTIGGLTNTELTEAKQLLRKLQEGN